MKFNYTQFLESISYAIDLAEIDYFKVNLNHSRRVAYISLVIAKDLKLDAEDVEDLFALALLHDNGVTMSAIKYHKTNFELLPEHCKIGEKNIKNLLLRKKRKNVILYHHENYDGSGLFKKKKEEIPFLSLIISFADNLDFNFDLERLKPTERSSVKNYIEENKGKIFHPEICEALLNRYNCERFWCDLKFYNKELVLNRIAPKIEYDLSWKQIRELCSIFVDIIDSKSRFTYNHTKGVVKLVEMMCEYYKYQEDEKEQMIIAAYLHDLGKLYVPNEILDKPDSLNNIEFYEIKQHTYYTKLLLEKIEGFKKIAKWAANHHEKLNGKGYPECLNVENLDLNSKIIAICDIYQALTEDRPYRKGLSKEEAYKIIKQMVDGGYICGKVFNDFLKIIK
ncbi:MAG TPA: HD domain-containing protein [bacterium]|nr:HD domain-containing protein [bacterium]HOL48132.1 HD domain-containing protein [bacterium]HPQ18544.1 HD domain-containing protein [bacterium]